MFFEFYQTEQQEKVHLQQLISIINDTIHNTDTSVKEHVEILPGEISRKLGK